MIQVSNERIPKDLMPKFHEIIKSTDSRYTSNPRDCGDHYRVNYTPGDYVKLQSLWNSIVEEYNRPPPTKFEKLKSKIKSFFAHKNEAVTR